MPMPSPISTAVRQLGLAFPPLARFLVVCARKRGQSIHFSGKFGFLSRLGKGLAMPGTGTKAGLLEAQDSRAAPASLAAMGLIC
jgi:hypothetical protein